MIALILIVGWEILITSGIRLKFFNHLYDRIDSVISHFDTDPSVVDNILKKYPNFDVKEGVLFKIVEMTARPRIIKAHLPFDLLPRDFLDTAKVRTIATRYKFSSQLSFLINNLECVD